MKKDIEKLINSVVERGLSDQAIKTMLRELYETETINFDDVGNPYWKSCGDSIDPDVELVFED